MISGTSYSWPEVNVGVLVNIPCACGNIVSSMNLQIVLFFLDN